MRQLRKKNKKTTTVRQLNNKNKQLQDNKIRKQKKCHASNK